MNLVTDIVSGRIGRSVGSIDDEEAKAAVMNALDGVLDMAAALRLSEREVTDLLIELLFSRTAKLRGEDRV